MRGWPDHCQTFPADPRVGHSLHDPDGVCPFLRGPRRPYWIGDLMPLGCTPISLKHLIQGEHATLPPSRALTEAEESVSDTKCHNIVRSETPHRRYLAVWRRLLFRRPLFPASIVQHCISTRLTMTEYTYERAQKRWRRSETIEILSIRDTQIALFPLSFVALGGDNTWSYILDTIQQLVEVAAGGAGVIMYLFTVVFFATLNWVSFSFVEGSSSAIVLCCLVSAKS